MAVQLDRHRTDVPISRKLDARFGREAALPGLLAASTSLLIAYLVLQLWNTSLSSPWSLGGEDLWSVLLYMKTTLQHAWPVHNPLLGAPFGQDLQDYPLGDPIQILLTKMIGVFSGDAVVVTNVFFLLTFPLTALTALWTFRRLGVSTWPAVACAVLFAVAPYHFFQGVDHLMIAAYYTVPFSAYLVTTQLAGTPPSLRTTIVLSLLIGAAFTYYVIFTLVLLGFAVLVSLAARRRAAALRGLLALAVIGGVLAIAHTPTWIYDLQHGGNPAVRSLHSADQSERFALKLPRMVFPVEGHEIGPFASLTRRFDERSPSQLQEGPPQALGLLATLGFLALLWIGLTAIFRRPATDGDPYLRASAGTTVVALVLGLTGGAGLVIAYTISPLVRSWARLSIVIAFLALFAVARALDRIGPALVARGVRPLLVAVGLVGLVAAAATEQTSRAMVPNYGQLALTWQADSAFTARAEQVLPRDSFVLDLPYIPYPEAVYVQARQFMHTDRLRWTFGAMSGRPADWTSALAELPPRTVAQSAAAAGASAILLDRAVYPNGGRALAKALTGGLGQPLVASAGDEFELYDLRPLAARMRAQLGAAAFARLGYLVLHPAIAEPGPQLSPPQTAPGSFAHYYRIAHSRTAQVDLLNPLPATRIADLSIRIVSLGSARDFTLLTPGGGSAHFTATPDATGRGQIVLKPGHNRLTIVDTTPVRPFENNFFSIDRLVVQDQEAERLLSRAG